MTTAIQILEAIHQEIKDNNRARFELYELNFNFDSIEMKINIKQGEVLTNIINRINAIENNESKN